MPQREAAMNAYEMMLSESQERMLMVLRPGSEPLAEAIFRKWELDFAVIGETTDDGPAARSPIAACWKRTFQSPPSPTKRRSISGDYRLTKPPALHPRRRHSGGEFRDRRAHDADGLAASFLPPLDLGAI